MRWLTELDSGIKWELMQFWVEAAGTKGETLQGKTVLVTQFQLF